MTQATILEKVREIEEQMKEQMALNGNNTSEWYFFLKGKREGLLEALTLIEA